MALSIRQTSATQAGLNAALSSLNPVGPGETVRVYANADAAGDSIVVAIGTKTFGTIDLGVEAVTGAGPIVPDNLVAAWTQPAALGSADVNITLTGDNIDLLIFKE